MKWRCRHFPSVQAQIQDPSLDSMESSFLNYSCCNQIKEEKAICDTYSLTSGNCYKFPSLSGHFHCQREPDQAAIINRARTSASECEYYKKLTLFPGSSPTQTNQRKKSNRILSFLLVFFLLFFSLHISNLIDQPLAQFSPTYSSHLLCFVSRCQVPSSIYIFGL